MRSHLDQGGSNRAPDPRTHGNVVIRPGQERRYHNASGTVVDGDTLQRRAGGDVGYLEGARSPQSAHVNSVGLPREAQNWSGSGTIYSDAELPASPIGGGGFSGSMTQVSASDLDAIDRASGTYDGATRPAVPPPPPQSPPPQQGLQPGAYDMGNGQVLVVRRDGQRLQMTYQQYQQVIAAANAQRPLSPAEQVMAQIRSGQ